MNTSLSRLFPAAALGCVPAVALAAPTDGSDIAWGGLALIVLFAVAWGLLRCVQRQRTAAQRKAAAAPPQYKPEKVGNDASARPWESAAEERVQAATDGVRIPDGFDAAAFLSAAKDCYTRVQYARSSADTAALRALMDEDTFAREQAQPQPPPAGEVLTLEARLLEVRQGDDGEEASVEFSGMQGAGASGGYVPFREVWSMARPAAGQGAWRVAGIEPLAV